MLPLADFEWAFFSLYPFLYFFYIIIICQSFLLQLLHCVVLFVCFTEWKNNGFCDLTASNGFHFSGAGPSCLTFLTHQA